MIRAMGANRWRATRFCALLLLVVLGAADPARADEVPYVTTPDDVVSAMLSIAGVGAQDNLVDLGSGDGRIVIEAAARLGATALGIEYDKELVALSRQNAARQGVSDRATFLERDIFLTDIRSATVVTMYLLPEVNLKLRPRLLAELRPGTRVVSHDWDMGDWEPDDIQVIDNPEKTFAPIGKSTVYLWIVPARAEGRWAGTLEGRDGPTPVALELSQRYQSVSGTARFGGEEMTAEGPVRGDILSLTLDRPARKGGSTPLRFTLRVGENRMEGEARSGKQRFRLRAERRP